MTLSQNHRILLSITALLLSSLACRAATQLIFPATPTPLPTSTPTLTFTPTLTPTLTPTATPTMTPTRVPYEASCPQVVSQILDDSLSASALAHSSASASEEDVTYMAHYTVVGDELKAPLFYPVKDNLEDEQEDRAGHQKIWSLFTHLIPAEEREVLNGFVIFTDGRDNYLAAVNQSDNNPYKWDLNVDIVDSARKTVLANTLLHEYGHLLTLTGKQVEISVDLYHHPDDSEIYQREADACSQYFTGEGCSAADSYINAFFERFWVDLYTEWLEIDGVENERIRENKLDRFYNTYQDQFLTDYAPTSPAEDIAESFAFFILSPRPEPTSIANEKILFFHEYPALTELRIQILENVCKEFQA